MVMIETAAYDIFVTLYTLCEKAAVSAGTLADRGVFSETGGIDG